MNVHPALDDGWSRERWKEVSMHRLRFDMGNESNALLGLGLLLLILAGAGIVMGFLVCPQMKRAIAAGRCPCAALLGV